MLCGAFRPGHFEGVATIVAKLFNIVEPDVAVFGEKDFQQLTVIRHMTADLCLPVEVIGAPTVRDTDGLAMSSRNQYLTEAERAVAPALYTTLQLAAAQLQNADKPIEVIEREGYQALEKRGLRVDYFSVRRPSDLQPPEPADQALVVLVAARLGRARLIDNVQLVRPQALAGV